MIGAFTKPRKKVRPKVPVREARVTSVPADRIAKVPIYYNTLVKQCGLCLKVYSRREFSKLRSSPDDLHYLCRGCWSQRFLEKRGLVVKPLEGKARCFYCGEVKDKVLFGRDPRVRTGHQRMCRACYSEEHATRPATNEKITVDVTCRGNTRQRARRLPSFLSVSRLGDEVFPEQKKCRDCGQIKDLEEFYWESDPHRSFDGRRALCISCFTLRYRGRIFKRRLKRSGFDKLETAKGDAEKSKGDVGGHG